MPKLTIRQKALKAIDEHRVRVESYTTYQSKIALTGEVRGNGGDYKVTLKDGMWHCECICPKSNCYHIEAEKIMLRGWLPALMRSGK